MSFLAFVIIALAAAVIIGSFTWDYVGLWGPTIVAGAAFLFYTLVAAFQNMGVDDNKVNPTYTHMAWAGLAMFFVAGILLLVSKRLSTPAHIRAQEH